MQPATCFLVLALAGSISSIRAAETAGATISSTQLNSTTWQYNVVLANTGTTNLGTFWFSWVPGEDFMPTNPTSISSPSSWTAGVTGGGPGDGYAIQWVAGAGAELTAGNSLAGFSFQSTTSPTTMAGTSPFHPQAIFTSFVYSGGPFSDGGFQFEVQQVVAVPVAGFLDQFGAPALTFNGSTSFPDAGGLLIGPPGVAQAANGDVYVVGLDSAGGVHLNSYSFANSTWNGWQYSGGILDTSSGMTAAVAPNGVVWFTGRDVGNRYWINSWNGASFGGWTLVADGIFSSDSIPQIAIPSDGTIYVIGKDIGGRIWSNSYDPTNQTFTGWVDRQAVMIGQPSATAGQDGMVYVAVRSVSSNSPVYITQIPVQNGATANTWLNGGGLVDTDPQITSQGGTVYLLAEAGANTVYLLTFAESSQTFGTWNFTNGVLNDSTIAASGGNVFIAGRDSDDRIYWYSLAGNSWFLAGGAGVSSTILNGGK